MTSYSVRWQVTYIPAGAAFTANIFVVAKTANEAKAKLRSRIGARAVVMSARRAPTKGGR
jgi:hypothetical protein